MLKESLVHQPAKSKINIHALLWFKSSVVSTLLFWESSSSRTVIGNPKPLAFSENSVIAFKIVRVNRELKQRHFEEHMSTGSGLFAFDPWAAVLPKFSANLLYERKET